MHAKSVLSAQPSAFQDIDQFYGEKDIPHHSAFLHPLSIPGCTAHCFRPLMKPAKKTVAIATRLSNISMTWMSGYEWLLVLAEWLRFRPWWRRSWETIVPMQTLSSRKTSELWLQKEVHNLLFDHQIKMVKMVACVVKWSCETVPRSYVHMLDHVSVLWSCLRVAITSFHVQAAHWMTTCWVLRPRPRSSRSVKATGGHWWLARGSIPVAPPSSTWLWDILGYLKKKIGYLRWVYFPSHLWGWSPNVVRLR